MSLRRLTWMVLAELVGSAAFGASGIWSYNRKNFMYDREMRQHQEFQIIEMRCKQAELWREDVRDMVGLTEKKMDTYMVVNALMLGFTIALFAEGRLEPGTPEWLLWLYMLSLAGAFMMLLSSVWFAMHASVVATCNAVRLLTQLVRPPIPSWETLEATRTYGHAFEGVPVASMLRVPLLQTISEAEQAAGSDPVAADPWGLERRGDDIYELQHRPITDNRHTRLVRQAMKQWQAYDAFARVSMTMGAILLCYSLCYYVLGYILVQDGSPWAAWAAVAIFLGIASQVMRLDLSLTRKDKVRAQILLVGGPICASISSMEWAMYKSSAEAVALAVTPWAFLFHAAFMMDFLRLCRVVRQPGGSLLPTRFRSVLYLDIFGWLIRRQMPQKPKATLPSHRCKDRGSYQPVLAEVPADEDSDEDFEEKTGPVGVKSQHLQQKAHLLPTFSKDSLQARLEDTAEQQQIHKMSERLEEVSPNPWPGAADPSSVTSGCCKTAPSAPEWMRLSTFSDYGQKVPYYVHVTTGEVRHEIPVSGQSSFVPSPSFTDQLDEQNTPRAQPGDGSSPGPTGAWTNGGSSASTTAPPAHMSSLSSLSSRKEQAAQRIAGHQAFPHSTLKVTSPPALRPEDVDIVRNGPDGHAGSLRARERAGKHLQEERLRDDATGRLGQVSAPLLGVGPVGVIPEVSHDAFTPASYAPAVWDSVGFDMGPKERVDSGHDVFWPGQLPWYSFRSGVWLLAGLWFLGAIWSCGQFLRIPDIPDKVLPESVSISGLEVTGPELRAKPPDIPPFPPGRQISVNWPNERFQPSGISCDASGRHFAFSDEFQLYYATLLKETPPPTAKKNKTLISLSKMRLAPPCHSLEGHAMQDVAVVCGKQVSESDSCKALVLFDDGKELANCNILTPETDAMEPETVWTIAHKWLAEPAGGRGPEKVVSVAINSNCDDSTPSQSHGGGKSCVVVATNRDRVVKLRRHIKKDLDLVPSGALWNARGVQLRQQDQNNPLETTSSTLQILPGSHTLVLRDGVRNVHAINIQSARRVGTWKLPELPGRNWSGLAGGARHLYVMSLSQQAEPVQLWQFPLPMELSS